MCRIAIQKYGKNGLKLFFSTSLKKVSVEICGDCFSHLWLLDPRGVTSFFMRNASLVKIGRVALE